MQNPLNIKNTIVFPNEDGNHDIRFVDASYRELFTIPDHSNIIVSYPDGSQCSMPCTYMDDTHVDINGNPYHICEFAERMMAVSATYAPEHPQPNPTYGIYEIYQIADTHRTNYCFMGYKYAKYQLNPKDYRREYAGMLPKGIRGARGANSRVPELHLHCLARSRAILAVCSLLCSIMLKLAAVTSNLYGRKDSKGKYRQTIGGSASGKSGSRNYPRSAHALTVCQRCDRADTRQQKRSLLCGRDWISESEPVSSEKAKKQGTEQ